MISENVKISFCNYAINFKAPRNVSKSSEREMKNQINHVQRARENS